MHHHTSTDAHVVLVVVGALADGGEQGSLVSSIVVSVAEISHLFRAFSLHAVTFCGREKWLFSSTPATKTCR